MSVTKDVVDNNLFAQSFIPAFDSWFQPLYPLINTLYFKELIEKVNFLYQTNTIYPAKGNVLKAFRLCKWNELKVVILGQDPYISDRATGLAFANPPLYYNNPSPSLAKIKEAVEKNVYNGLNLNFDVTLENWAKQGVLLLNCALTVNKIAGDNYLLWNGFTSEVLKIISSEKQGIVFILWGSFAKSYKKDILNKENHHILEYHHPSFANYKKTIWDCPNFTQCNELLKEPIKW